MHRWMVVSAIAVAACGGPNFAGLKTGPRSANFQDRIVVRQLTNGLRVALLPDNRTNLVTVALRYNVGGADDPTGDSGLAHYVEHVLWEAPLLGRNGLRDLALDGNAMTGLDRTYFFSTVLDIDLAGEPDRDVEAIRTLELEAVRSLAARDLRPDRMIAAVRGPAAAIDKAITALGIDHAKVEMLKPSAASK